MKVILTAEVKGKGHEGDIVDVARGYAANYLLPRKMAIVATPGNIKQLEARMTHINKRNVERMTDAEGIAASIDGKVIVLEAKSGVDGKLFGSVTTLMIEEAIAAQLGADVDHKRMNLHKPIKTVGAHEIVVGVFGDVKATLVVKVLAEGGIATMAADEAAAAEKAAAEAVKAAEAAAAAEAAESEAVEPEAVAETVEASDDEAAGSDSE